MTAVEPVLVGWAGDAARYFGASPENPIERQEIRAKGVELLERLHHQEDANHNLEYDHIVVVGHSLGSVIAYDVLTHYWARVNTAIQTPIELLELDAIEKLYQGDTPSAPSSSWEIRQNAPDAERYHAAQIALCRALNTSAWRVTDLVTLGSPLTYARFLLAKNAADLTDRQQQRELPTCPPVRDRYEDQNHLRSFVHSFPPVTQPRCVVPHHAAPFLLTRWTNIYFPQDPTGGKLRPFFGRGIRDVKVSFRAKRNGRSKRTRWWFGHLLDIFGAAHIRYWQLDDNDPMKPMSGDCAKILRNII